MSIQVKITVHQRLDGQGYLVKIAAEGRAVKFPVDDLGEAKLLAESIKNGIGAGIPLEALMPEEPCVPVEGI